MPRSTRINIDLGAILHNAAVLRSTAGDKHVMAVVKADAYGHGAVPVATHIEGAVDAFAVALIEEAVRLRDAGVTKPILVLEGPHCAADLALCVHLNIWPTLHRADQLDWCHALTEKPEQVWLKIDTGMHRLGFQPVQAQSITQQLKAYGIKTVVGMSHLAAAETPDSELSVTQKRYGIARPPTGKTKPACTTPQPHDWRLRHGAHGRALVMRFTEGRLKG